MGQEEREDLLMAIVEANKAANKPLVNKIILSSGGVILTIFGACFWLGGQVRDVQETKKWREDTTPVIAQHETKIAIIETILKIKP